MKNILIVEDDEDISLLIKTQLAISSFHSEIVDKGSEVLGFIKSKGPFDAIILDWLLPEMNGIDICQQIRSQEEYKNIPIILLTALSQSENIIKGLDAGADDFISKPFEMNILLARLRALLRRTPENKNSDLLQFGDCEVNTKRIEVKIANERIHLTGNEYQIFKVLFMNPSHVFTRGQLIQKIQGENVFITERTIDTHIAGLRKKLKHCSNLIETIRGIGYRFAVELSTNSKD